VAAKKGSGSTSGSLVELVLIKDLRIEGLAVRDFREVEQAGANGPPVLIPLDGSPVGVTPGISGIIESAGVDDRPVHEIGTWIVRITVRVENIDDAEFADRQDEPVGGLSAGELVQPGLDLRFLPAQIDRLTQEYARNPGIGIGGADLIGFATGESCHAERL